MASQARIIIEHQSGEWCAWFSDVADFTRSAPTPGDAVTALLSLFTAIEFSHREISLDESHSREGHLEFLVPFQFLHSIPKPSVN